MLKIKNIINFLKIILKNNKKRILSLLIVYLIINFIFLLLLFIFTNFYNYIEQNKKYTNELSLKKGFDADSKDIFYEDYTKIEKILWNNWKIYKNYFLKIPTFLKIRFFTKKFDTDILLHVYNFEYLGVKNDNLKNEKINLIFSNKTLLLLENMILSNLNYENIIKYLDWDLIFGKNSFSKQKNIFNKKFKILGFNDKLAIYSIAVDEKQIKNILPKFFLKNKIKLSEINIIFDTKEELKKYKHILKEKWYNFSLKNKEFERTNKKLNLIYYYFFIPIFIIFFILLNMIINLNLENSIFKNKDIVLNLKYLKINKFYLIFIFYLEYFLIFIFSLLLLILFILLGLYFYWANIDNGIIIKYFNLKLFLYFSFILYFIVFIYSFFKTSLKFLKK